jgi:FkbM family methyltransferase
LVLDLTTVPCYIGTNFKGISVNKKGNTMQAQKNVSFLTIFFFLSMYATSSSALLSFNHPQEALALAAQYLPNNPVIIEAGAYDGAESLVMAQKWPQGFVYTFEPIPYLYANLVKTTIHQPNIFTYPYAVGDKVGRASMYVSESPSAPGIPSQSSSLLAPKEHLNYSNVLFKKVINVPVTTFDVWAEENNVDHVDLMWLDMQGYELNALMASPKILSTVRVILTEVELVEAYANQYQFEEVKSWLEEQGFELIARNNYCSWFEDALFVRKELLSAE